MLKPSHWRIICALTMLFGALEVRSQGTTFTYQGRLDDSGFPANAAYDLKFSVYDAITNGNVVGVSNVFQYVAVTNGLFTLAINPGAGVFIGSPRWLQTEVRPGSNVGPFTILMPRQRIFPTPEAIFAAMAATVVTGSVSATSIAAGQVVKGVNGLTDGVLLSAGNNISLTTNGNNISIHTAPGLLSWQPVSGTAQTANTNHGYLLTSDALPTLTLPATANLSDIVRVSGIGSNGWKVAQNAGQSIRIRNLPGNIGVNWTPRASALAWSSIASSSDGKKLVAGTSTGLLYVSSDGGSNWGGFNVGIAVSGVACSSFGIYQVAALNGGQLYVSTNSGSSWTARATSQNWVSVCCSADGSIMLAGIAGGYNYVSFDYGFTWTQYAGAGGGKLACSADGARVVVAVNGGKIYTSSDSGQTWALSLNVLAAWSGVASSADGSKLAAVVNGGLITISTDGGASWAAHASSQAWNGVTCSADGNRLVATVSGGQIYTSYDVGVTWSAHESNRSWTAVASSVDETKLAATVAGGQIYTSDNFNPVTTTGTAGYLIGEPNSAVELQYIGGNQFIPISHDGFITGY